MSAHPVLHAWRPGFASGRSGGNSWPCEFGAPRRFASSVHVAGRRMQCVVAAWSSIALARGGPLLEPPTRGETVRSSDAVHHRPREPVSAEPPAPADLEIQALLLSRPVIAVVGASSHPARPSHEVMGDLLEQGYDVIPVHPVHPVVHGLRTYPDLHSIPRRVDLVDVFRRPEATPEVARQAVAIGARALWLQLGVVNWEACRIARGAGLVVVMDRCLMVEHRRLVGTRFGRD